MSWFRFVVSSGLLLLVLIGIMYPISKFDNLPEVVVGWGTVMLASATFMLVRHGKDQENRDRKDRLLNEIIQWLRGIEEHIFPSAGRISKEILEDITTKAKSGISIDTWQSLENLDRRLIQLNNLRSEVKEGSDIQKLAKRINGDLGSLIEILLDNIEQRKQLVLDSSKTPNIIADVYTIRERVDKESELINKLIEDVNEPLEGSGLSEEGLISVRFARNAGIIRKSILNAIDKAIELKMNLLES